MIKTHALSLVIIELSGYSWWFHWQISGYWQN